jgi:2-polyprenyl-3-methyl-5-hydroxy-6-metoxy-1,4-benzoquinol methylase
MADCCNPRGCDQFFGPRYARSAARRYRKHGLDRAARRMVAFLERRGLVGATVLEVGGGVGEIQIELLKRGAARAVNLELVAAYNTEAQQLLREAGLTDRAQRRVHDIAVDPEGIEPADVVVLHRVVCCYPDYQRLLSSAADHARRLLVFSYPPHNAVGRLVVGAENAVFKILRKEYRAFTHPPDAMLAVLRERGLRTTYTHHGPVWQVAGLERQNGPNALNGFAQQ